MKHKFKFNTSSYIKYILLAMIVCVVLSSAFINDTIAKFVTGADTYDESRVSIFNIENLDVLSGIKEQILTVPYIKPGQTFEKEITITNSSEVAIEYELKIKTTKNIPLKFGISGSTAEELSYTGTLDPNGDIATETLYITWPSDDNSVEYSGMVDAVNLSLEIIQKD